MHGNTNFVVTSILVMDYGPQVSLLELDSLKWRSCQNIQLKNKMFNVNTVASKSY